MEFGEVIAAIALFVGMPWAVFSGIAKVKAASVVSKLEGTGGAEIRKSELDAMIAVAVDDATTSLQRRVEVLEAIVTDEAESFDRIDPAVLSDALDADGPAAARRRTRS